MFSQKNLNESLTFFFPMCLIYKKKIFLKILINKTREKEPTLYDSCLANDKVVQNG